MKYITTADESRSLDREAMKSYGFPEAVLMENAGSDVVSLIQPEIDWKGKSVVVVCGTGNNGGDGFVIARYLCALTASVAVLLCGNEAHMSETARLYRRIVEKMGVQVIPVSEDTDWETPLESADVIVDALIGTGLSREVSGVKAEVIEMMNASHASVVSVDVPSGLSSDTGEPMGLAVMADYTVALESYKRCHVLSPGQEYCGKVLYSAIGLPAAVGRSGRSLPVSLIEEREVRNLLPLRERMCHKGKNGFIGIIAGSAGMEGAALLAGQGALHAGAGKVAVVTVPKAAAVIAGKVPELMVSSVGDSDFFTSAMAEEVLPKAEAYDVLAIGPGLGRGAETGRFVKEILTRWRKPIIVDADALYAVKEMEIDLARCPGQLILTPHVGEFAHLTGRTAAEAERERIDGAIAFAMERGVTLVLKGMPTVIATADGFAYVNVTGNPGMATGGMGDTLTGIIAALVGQEMDPEPAAICGVYLHGLSGDLLARETPVGYTASDVARMVPRAREMVTGD